MINFFNKSMRGKSEIVVNLIATNAYKWRYFTKFIPNICMIQAQLIGVIFLFPIYSFKQRMYNSK